jgi:hypothetical protein
MVYVEMALDVIVIPCAVKKHIEDIFINIYPQNNLSRSKYRYVLCPIYMK